MQGPPLIVVQGPPLIVVQGPPLIVVQGPPLIALARSPKVYSLVAAPTRARVKPRLWVEEGDALIDGRQPRGTPTGGRFSPFTLGTPQRTCRRACAFRGRYSLQAARARDLSSLHRGGARPRLGAQIDRLCESAV